MEGVAVGVTDEERCVASPRAPRRKLLTAMIGSLERYTDCTNSEVDSLAATGSKPYALTSLPSNNIHSIQHGVHDNLRVVVLDVVLRVGHDDIDSTRRHGGHL